MEGASGLDHLICDFPGYLEHKVKEEERHMGVECGLGCRLWRADESEEVAEERWPLLKVGDEEKQRERM